MWPPIQKIVDSVFPPSTDELLVRSATYEAVWSRYQPTTRYGTTILLPFSDPMIRALIHQAKFHYDSRAYELLASVLTAHLSTTTHTEHWLVPVPLSRQRWHKRGYNQVTETARRVAAEVPASTLEPTILARTRHTKPQTSLSRGDRLNNLSGAFRCRYQPPPAAIIILDDVCTTGSTLQAAYTACRAAYPSLPIVRLALAG